MQRFVSTNKSGLENPCVQRIEKNLAKKTRFSTFVVQRRALGSLRRRPALQAVQASRRSRNAKPPERDALRLVIARRIAPHRGADEANPIGLCGSVSSMFRAAVKLLIS
jgi:hypothetical protein